jgi:hypothetical protein
MEDVCVCLAGPDSCSSRQPGLLAGARSRGINSLDSPAGWAPGHPGAGPEAALLVDSHVSATCLLATALE